MFNKIILSFSLAFCVICLNAKSIDSGVSLKPPYEGNRILLTSIHILESNKEELRISMNAINTGRNLIEFGVFSEIPEDLELKFEESFYRSSLKDKEIEIKNLLFAKILKLPAGKIIRNIELNLSSDEELYKSLSKKKQRYARHYQPKQDKTKPDLKYKTTEDKSSALSAILKKKKKKETVPVKTEIIIEEETIVENTKTEKKQEGIAREEERKLAEMKRKEKEDILESEKKKQEEFAQAQAKNLAEYDKKEKETTAANLKKKESAEKAAQKQKQFEADKQAALAKKQTKEEAQEKANAIAEAKKKEEIKMIEEANLAAVKIKKEKEEKQKQEDLARAKAKKEAAERAALAEAKKKEEARKIEEAKKAEQEEKRLAAAKKKTSKKTIKETDEKFKQIEKEQKKKEDDKAVLSALGLEEKEIEKETQTSKPSKKRSGSLLGGKEEPEEKFDISESISASKNSYAEKEVCPDLYIDTIFVVKRNNKWLEIEYILNNSGKGPAHLLGASSSDEDNLAVRAFLSSTDKLTRGSLPIGGGFIYNSPNDGLLEVNGTYRGKLKLDIKKLTRFTPYLILSVDPFNAITECDKTNNKHPSLINQ